MEGIFETDWWAEERAAAQAGYTCIVGIDEAGRGALAGPVVAACVLLPFGWCPKGLNDSKQLTPCERETLYETISQKARAFGVAVVDAERIDAINILRATHEAMRSALAALPKGLFPDLALIDGLPVRPFPIPQKALVKGDARCASIAAASVVAKVTRDRIMHELDRRYPVYGFANHKGYATQEHLKALQVHGPCPLHRRSFRPVAEICTLWER
ncbi:ribonuclease HII [Chthonomonas calidirosea]|uniref:Ribonuclease HII n=1 Tax=Chthonomonas calidirosea (strain DSM 23976 / ICMP 18418 / T49) TaxID=1303518 RepID=S0EY46_CHTCT|nr:ribonuclease HII [Chthonomonas calidirosea]CCW36469.1 RNase HII [Chthonomonas calidirosea T49]CEK16156.1 RNase HII [Chthonomonas calidirosea]CEK17247.1 RNase HII [Chthonomonas calidirosea]